MRRQEGLMVSEVEPRRPLAHRQKSKPPSLGILDCTSAVSRKVQEH